MHEYNNDKHAIKIYIENNEPPTELRKLKNNTQIQMTSRVITTSEPLFNQESTNSVVHKIKTKMTGSKTALKTKNKTVQKKMGSKAAHKKSPQVK